MEMSFTAKIPFAMNIRKSNFEGGCLMGWHHIEEAEIEVPVKFETDLDLFSVEIECDKRTSSDEDFAAEYSEVIREADWHNNFEDFKLENAVRYACTNVSDDICDMDDEGNGCDGVVQVHVCKDIPSEFSWEGIGDIASILQNGIISYMDWEGIARTVSIYDGPEYYDTFYYNTANGSLAMDPNDLSWE